MSPCCSRATSAERKRCSVSSSGRAAAAPLHVDEFITLDHDGLESILTTFLEKHGVGARDLEASSFGVAGAITDQVAQLTNVPWRIDAGEMMRHGFLRVRLLNDLEAMAYAIPVLAADEVAVLQEGSRSPAATSRSSPPGRPWRGNAPQHRRPAGARTIGRRPRRLRRAHAAGARDGRALTRVFGRVSAEHILSGPGLVNVYRFTHDILTAEARGSMKNGSERRPSSPFDTRGCGPVSDPSDLPARISAIRARRQVRPIASKRWTCSCRRRCRGRQRRLARRRNWGRLHRRRHRAPDPALAPARPVHRSVPRQGAAR